VKFSILRFIVLTILAVTLAACSGDEGGEANDVQVSEAEATPVPNAIDSQNALTEATNESPIESETTASAIQPEAMNERPAWMTMPLVDAVTGETFTLADFSGQTVFVEPMATWCTTCRQQFNQLIVARERLAGEPVVFIGLSVEVNDVTTEDMAAYVQDYGYDWTFAVMTEAIFNALIDEFGFSINNPPSTPHFIIRADGTHTDLDAGVIETADQIVDQIQAAMGA